jgi:hypothetical protein
MVPSVLALTGATEETMLLTVGATSVLSCRPTTAEEVTALFRLLGPMCERQRRDLKRLTDFVVVEEGRLIYWPRTGELFSVADLAYALARVRATLA